MLILIYDICKGFSVKMEHELNNYTYLLKPYEKSMGQLKRPLEQNSSGCKL